MGLFTQNQREIDQINIEQISTEAYHEAIDILDGLEMLNLLKDKHVLGLKLLSSTYGAEIFTETVSH
jgi:hypothetical protein